MEQGWNKFADALGAPAPGFEPAPNGAPQPVGAVEFRNSDSAPTEKVEVDISDIQARLPAHLARNTPSPEQYACFVAAEVDLADINVMVAERHIVSTQQQRHWVDVTHGREILFAEGSYLRGRAAKTVEGVKRLFPSSTVFLRATTEPTNAGAKRGKYREWAEWLKTQQVRTDMPWWARAVLHGVARVNGAVPTLCELAYMYIVPSTYIYELVVSVKQ